MKRFTIVMVLSAILGVVDGISAKENTPKPESASGAVIDIPEKEIDLGTILPGQDEVVGEVFFFNNGDKPLQVKKVTGPCVCYTGYSGDKILQPDEGGILEVKFDKKKIEAGPVKRHVNVLTNDPDNESVKVDFTFFVERDPAQEEIRILKSELSAIRKEMRIVRKELAKIIALLKADRAPAPPPITNARTGRCARDYHRICRFSVSILYSRVSQDKSDTEGLSRQS
ncbi:MAG: DUF1573 domain-containing protein [Planctomycetota bacterium]